MAHTHGSKMLADLPFTGASIAERLGASPMAVSYWRRGTKAPSPKIRVVLEQIFKIPAGAWDVEVGAPLPAPSSSSAAVPEAPPPVPPVPGAPDLVATPAAAEAALRTLGRQPTIAQVDALLERIRTKAEAPGLPAQVVARFYAVEASALAKRLEAEERAELRDNRAERERRVLVVCKRYLSKHPEDAPAFLDDLRQAVAV